jgi:hypothetical protein
MAHPQELAAFVMKAPEAWSSLFPISVPAYPRNPIASHARKAQPQPQTYSFMGTSPLVR